MSAIGKGNVEFTTLGIGGPMTEVSGGILCVSFGRTSSVSSLLSQNSPELSGVIRILDADCLHLDQFFYLPCLWPGKFIRSSRRICKSSWPLRGVQG